MPSCVYELHLHLPPVKCDGSSIKQSGPAPSGLVSRAIRYGKNVPYGEDIVTPGLRRNVGKANEIAAYVWRNRETAEASADEMRLASSY